MIPLSTYRLQLHAGFTFEDAAGIADYLKALGVSHAYCSPYLQAVPGSLHGYDVVDPERPNEELGGEAGLARFTQRLKETGLGQILDIVPNHMALGVGNRYWWDVLENGQSSRFADWFDIDWRSSEVKLQNKVLIPILGDQYGKVLTAGEITLQQEGDAFQVRYMDHRLPLAPRSISSILWRAAQYTPNDMLTFIAESFSRLPSRDETDHELAESRHRDKAVIYALLKRLNEEQHSVCEAITHALDDVNHDVDAMDRILNQQNYRLAYWRTADQELGYRRFFDVTTLIGVRTEREHVFKATHCRILEWLANGTLDGVRVDHPDGLRDPQQYFERLRAHAPEAWIVAEKILEPGEALRTAWPVDGTTGYDFANVCNALLMNPEGLQRLSHIYGEFTDEPVDFAVVARDKKLAVQQEALGSDINRLTSLFVEICESNRDRRDYTRAEIRRALREVATCFPVYRTYVVADGDRILDEDRAYIDRAVCEAKGRREDVDPGLFDFIAEVLSLRSRGSQESEFVMRFQQFTSPVMAKGVEDTAFYCFNRMIGLNEVGGDPGLNGMSIEEFHTYCSKMQDTHPRTMTTLSTHDTKRADDVRARLAALTEIPTQWRAFLRRWSRRNSSLRTGVFPDRNTEIFLYQTMIGAWPISQNRLIAYMEKATREAKQHTSWTQQNKDFEDALRTFIAGVLGSEEFIAALDEIVASVREAGWSNSLAQTLIKCTAPGIPDLYQGSELWDLSLVDPDNRRPVDYEQRREMLAALQGGMGIDEVMQRRETGMPKLWLIHTSLDLRRNHPQWFDETAAYLPIHTEGAKSDHLIAFIRGEAVITLAPRWPLKLAGNWGSTTIDLPMGVWKNVLTGEVYAGGRVRVQQFFQRFPVGLLIREETSGNA